MAETRRRIALLVTVAGVLAATLPGTAAAAPPPPATAAPLPGAAAAPLPGAAAAPLPPAGASVVRNGVTQPVYSYADAVRETVYVEVPFDRDRDGRRDRVAADVIRPREPAAAGRRVPVIMDASPYYRCCGRGNESEVKAYGPDGRPTAFPLFYDNWFVPRGYAVVLVDLPGTARSTGCMDTGGRSEVVSARTVVDWLNGRAAGYRADGTAVRATWATGAVGMIGKSWDGSIANGVAATGVPGLRTVVPIAAISSWYDYLRWRGLVPLEREVGGLASIDLDYPIGPDDPEDPCTPELPRLDAAAADDTGNYTPFWAERDYRRTASRVRASVFLVHGLNDLNVKTNQLAPWWAALGRAGVTRKLWLTPVGHVDPFDLHRAEWVRTLHRWFDSELYGIPNGIRSEPPVTRESTPGVVVRERAWPAPPAAAPVRLTLGAGPAAGPDRLGGAPGAARRAFTDDPEQTEAEMVAAPGVRSGRRLLFLSPPLARDVRLSGTAEVVVRASVDRPTTPLTAALVDYGPSTRVDLSDYGGGIRTVDTESCWGASTAADDGCYRETEVLTTPADAFVLTRGLADAAHRRSLLRRDPLRPGVDYTLRWLLLPQDVTVARGHQLGLVLAASDLDMMYLPGETSATVSVRLAGSTLSLPVVGGTMRFTAADRVPVVRRLPAPAARERAGRP